MEDNKEVTNVVKMNSVALSDAESMGTDGCLVSWDERNDDSQVHAWFWSLIPLAKLRSIERDQFTHKEKSKNMAGTHERKWQWEVIESNCLNAKHRETGVGSRIKSGETPRMKTAGRVTCLEVMRWHKKQCFCE